MPCCDHVAQDGAIYKCEKHQRIMCAACLECKDPELYCKFRPSCMIHFIEKERRKENKKTATSA